MRGVDDDKSISESSLESSRERLINRTHSVAHALRTVRDWENFEAEAQDVYDVLENAEVPNPDTLGLILSDRSPRRSDLNRFKDEEAPLRRKLDSEAAREAAERIDGYIDSDEWGGDDALRLYAGLSDGYMVLQETANRLVEDYAGSLEEIESYYPEDGRLQPAWQPLDKIEAVVRYVEAEDIDETGMGEEEGSVLY